MACKLHDFGSAQILIDTSGKSVVVHGEVFGCEANPLFAGGPHQLVHDDASGSILLGVGDDEDIRLVVIIKLDLFN